MVRQLSAVNLEGAFVADTAIRLCGSREFRRVVVVGLRAFMEGELR
jgi:hypothetical protein